MTADEKRSALALHDAMCPKFNADAFRAAARTSRAEHGETRHDVVKAAAMHASKAQIKRWRKETTP